MTKTEKEASGKAALDAAETILEAVNSGLDKGLAGPEEYAAGCLYGYAVIRLGLTEPGCEAGRIFDLAAYLNAAAGRWIAATR